MLVRMNQKGGILVGVIAVSLLIIPLLVVLNFNYLGSLGDRFTTGGEQEEGSSSGPAGLINQAEQTKVQADLRTISVGITAYYAERGTFPSSLQNVSEYLGNSDKTNIVYVKCSGSSALIYHNSENYPGYILGSSGQTPTSGEIPSC